MKDSANWEEERFTLQRLLVRTSLMAEGQDPGLDQLLDGLRDALRDDCELRLLKTYQSQLDQALTRLDQTKSTASDSQREAVSQLLHILQRDYTDPEADTPDADKPIDVVPAIRPRVRDSVTDASAQEESDQRFRIAIRVGELLDHMLGQVSLDSDAHNRAQQLREQLRTSDAWDDLRFALNEIVDLVIAAISRGRSEFEDFLKQLDERLLAMKDTFELQEQADAGRRTAADELDKSVATRLGTIGELVDESSNIGSLKSSVSQHLQAIASSLGSYRQQEHQREQVLEQKLATMQERLAGMEAYSEKMQEQLSFERDRAMTDALTQLPNRGAWQERFQLEFDRWQRYQNPVMLVILDIDHFKTVNDTYGHKVGDRMIQLVAKTLRDRLRKTDFVARYGGEEFVALLPETDVNKGVEVVDNLREHIADLPFRFQETPVRITVSAGAVAFSGDNGPDALFEKADRALYRAKNGGRNQVVSADSDSG